MRLLLLSPYPPYPPRSGGALRIYNLLNELARRHEVWLLTFAPHPQAEAALEPLRQVCHLRTVQGPPTRTPTRRAWSTLFSPLPDMALRNSSPAYVAALRQLVYDQHFDVVQAESIEMAGYGLLARAAAAEQWGTQPAPALVLDEFNAEYVLQQRAARADLAMWRLWRTWRTWRTSQHERPDARRLLSGGYSLIQWHKLARYECWLLRAYAHTLAVSEEDRRALHRLAPAASISVVPNGVDTRTFAREYEHATPAGTATTTTLPQGGPLLVFTGSLDFRPNIDAVTWFVRAVLPRIQQHRPDARFVVVGRSPAPAVRALHNGTSVDVVGEVADVRPYIAAASAYVVPMRIGGGVRLKVLEAMAMCAPVVSTTMGAEGIVGLHDGEHVLLADTPAAFAAAVVRLLHDPAHGEGMGRAAHALVSQHYDWRVIVPLVDEVYATLGGSA